MFDLVSGRAAHIPHHSTVPFLVSAATETMTAAAVISISLLWMTDAVPVVTNDFVTMMATVAEPPPPPPPPPPPAKAAEASAPRPVVPPANDEAPVIDDAPANRWTASGDDEEGEGVPGGVEGGVPGGVVGGVVGSVLLPVHEVLPPPPPAPVHTAPAAPVRVGGALKAPELVWKVVPEYPDIARHAHLRGTVIIDAVVNEDGSVTSATVVRSTSRLFEATALTAVRAWRYKPLLLDDVPTPFVLTVTITFSER
jgi:periplasmic protein TonB